MNAITAGLAPQDAQALLDDLPLGVALVDGRDRVRGVNRALERQLGCHRDRLCAGTFAQLPLVRAEHQTGDGQLMRVAEPQEFGTEWVMVSDGPVLDGTGEPLRVRFFQDVTELEQARSRVDRLTQAMRGQVATDNTTGLLNRRATLNQLESQVSRSRRYHNLLSVVLVHVNCGDDAGAGLSENVVLAVGRMLRDQTRWPDIIGRWEKRDFLLILPETSAESARQLQDKVAEQLQQLPVSAGGEPLRCSAEFGTAEWRKGDSAADLVRRAEEARVAVV